MKIFSAKTALSVLSFSLFALCLVDTYFVHKSDVDASIIRLKEALKTPSVAQTTETEEENANN